jgi:hypothetical protein
MTRSAISERVVVVSLALVLCAGCSKAVRVAPADYPQMGARAGPYLVTTRAGDHYRAMKLRVSGEVLEVVELSRSDPRWKKAQLPIVVPLEHVLAVETREPRLWKTAAVVGGTLIGGYLLVWLALHHSQ